MIDQPSNSPLSASDVNLSALLFVYLLESDHYQLADMGFQIIPWLKSITTMPVIVKGVLRGSDGESLGCPSKFTVPSNSAQPSKGACGFSHT